METFSALLAIYAGNSPLVYEFPVQRPVTRSFDVFFDLCPNNGSVNNREASDLIRHRIHYDVIVLVLAIIRHKGQWRGALIFSLICARINGWVNNRDAGDLRRHRTHYDVIVMGLAIIRPLDGLPYQHAQRWQQTQKTSGIKIPWAILDFFCAFDD